MQLLILVTLFIFAFIGGCIGACVDRKLRQACKKRKTRNARATDNVELGVIVRKSASEERGSDVALENKPAGCHIKDCSEDSAYRLRHIDSEDEPEGRVGKVVLHAFAKFAEELVRDLVTMAQMKRGGTVVINHWIPPSFDAMLHRHPPYTRMLNILYEDGALSSIFDTSRRGHDGAVIIDLFNEENEEFKPTVRCCGFTFPLNEVPIWNPNESDAGIGGMRRSSALRMTHYTNCSIFVVSEDEGGCVSHFRMGKRQRDLTSKDIRHVLEQAYQRAYLLKKNEWPFTSSDVLAERTTLCERYTTNYAKYTFNIVDHARALWECKVDSQMAIQKNIPREDAHPVSGSGSPEAARRMAKTKHYQTAHEVEWSGLFNESVSGLFEEVWRKIGENDEWLHSDCLLEAFITVANRAVNDDSKCALLAYGPLLLGSIEYRIVDGNKMLLINTPETRPDLFDHALHFIVEVLCKRVHGCQSIVWLIASQIVEFLLPLLESLKARRNMNPEKKYAIYCRRANAQMFVCEVKNYHAPAHLRLT